MVRQLFLRFDYIFFGAILQCVLQRVWGGKCTYAHRVFFFEYKEGRVLKIELFVLKQKYILSLYFETNPADICKNYFKRKTCGQRLKKHGRLYTLRARS